MRCLLRFLVLIPLLLSFLLFASVHWEEGTTPVGLKTRSLQLGLSQSPWLEYEKVYVDATNWDTLWAKADGLFKSEEEKAVTDLNLEITPEDEAVLRTFQDQHEPESRFQVVLLSWSWGFGFITLVMLWFYWKLRPRRAKSIPME